MTKLERVEVWSEVRHAYEAIRRAYARAAEGKASHDTRNAIRDLMEPLFELESIVYPDIPEESKPRRPEVI